MDGLILVALSPERINTMFALRTRPIGMGHLRAFEAVARHLNFRLAADQLALTTSAISRHIQGLESEVGTVLFVRHARSIELTAAGAHFLATVRKSLTDIDGCVKHLRTGRSRSSIAVTTFASFASMWLIPKLESFQQQHPDIDIRIDASDAPVDLASSDIDVALRYGPMHKMPPNAIRLFGEQLIPVASPWLLKSLPRLDTPADLKMCPLIEASDPHRSHLDWLTWRHWLSSHGLPQLQPQRWLHFNYAYQMVQAALSGQGVVLARPPLIAESLVNGDLVEVLPGHRTESPMAYWLLTHPNTAEQAHIKDFAAWLIGQAQQTQVTLDQA
jgi:DNA-binding transcriptional LysR family regulator